MKHLLDDTPLNFGKYKDKTPNEISGYDKSYIVWLFDNLNEKFCTKKLRNACEDAAEDNWDYGKDEDTFYESDGW